MEYQADGRAHNNIELITHRKQSSTSTKILSQLSEQMGLFMMPILYRPTVLNVKCTYLHHVRAHQSVLIHEKV